MICQMYDFLSCLPGRNYQQTFFMAHMDSELVLCNRKQRTRDEVVLQAHCAALGENGPHKLIYVNTWEGH